MTEIVIKIGLHSAIFLQQNKGMYLCVRRKFLEDWKEFQEL